MGRVPILFFVGLGSEGAIRVKNVGAFAVAMMLAVLMPAWCAYAESRDAQVRYEVSATVIHVDGETETVQKVPVGSILKAPNPKGSTGGTFAGWWNEESGAYWDFSAPVEESMTLAAQYAYLESDEEAARPGASASAGGQTVKARTLLETGDASTQLALPVLLLGVFAVGVACGARRLRRRK